ncbi:hypothetical protein [Acrocarpospora catenulata]|uniref:hypothetical protein n=1 Tax=Acrocarpospora catenulata TaxID=2836182 RepID=UPI001BD945BE|nr:hypothetical protein [Acrocarpospora catenulata]
MSTVRAQWAIHGKLDRSWEEYAVIDSSHEPLARSDFTRIIDLFKSGTMEAHEQTKVGTSYFTGADGQSWVGLSRQSESDSRDGLGRIFAITEFVCVPWRELPASRVSYRALYDALNKRGGLPGPQPVILEVAGYDAAYLAGKVTDIARAAAALLLTGEHVCVVGADHLDFRERLDFLDAAAALLPYGFRRELAVSTWTSSSTRHRIRLSFAEVAPPDSTFKLQWRPDGSARVHDVPGSERIRSYVMQYEETLRGYQGQAMTNLIGFLAGQIEPRSFEKPEDCRSALSLLREPLPEPQPKPRPQPLPKPLEPAVRDQHTMSAKSPVQLLEDVLDAFRRWDRPRLGQLILRLRELADAGIPDPDRLSCRQLVRTSRLRFQSYRLNLPELQSFVPSLVNLLFTAPVQTGDIMEVILPEDKERRPTLNLRQLVCEELALLPGDQLSPAAKLLVADFSGRKQLQSMLSEMADEKLMEAAYELQSEVPTRIAVDEIIRRLFQEKSNMIDIVGQSNYLLRPIRFIASGEERIRYYRNVINACLGSPPRPEGLETILRQVSEIPEDFRAAAVLEAPPRSSSVLLTAIVMDDVRRQGLEGTPTGIAIDDRLSRMATPATEPTQTDEQTDDQDDDQDDEKPRRLNRVRNTLEGLFGVRFFGILVFVFAIAMTVVLVVRLR